MDPAAILGSVAILGGVGLLFGALIAGANKKLRVWEDPRIDEVENLLPGTNCGACGTPGCRPFAESLLDGANEPVGCTVMGPDETDIVADYLGVDAGTAVKRVARLLCAGGTDVARKDAEYHGHATCKAATAVSGGAKSCRWGCLGLADCEVSCDFDAIHMSETGLPVVNPSLCTACNDCVEVCPKDLFVLQSVEEKLIVQCRSLLEGQEALDTCDVACTGCGLCAIDAETDDLIEIKDSLAIIDYQHNADAAPKAAKRCPTDAILWVDGAQFPEHQRSDEVFAV